MSQIAFNTYGKTGVRLTQVLREGERHKVVELHVNILFEGDFDASYTAADNSRVLPTDTMKNVVYVIARRHPIGSIERFAADLANHHLGRLGHVQEVTVEIEQTPWDRIGNHSSAFVQSGGERRVVNLIATRSNTLLRSGLSNLELLKTGHSGFSGFLKDEYTTLPETDDRLLGTVVDADWSYKPGSIDYNLTHSKVRKLLLDSFADHKSLSVQHTLFGMGTVVLEQEPAVQDIHLVMPNKHRLLVDLSRFGLDNPNQIFIPTDEPSGYIEATIEAPSQA
jgi:urate oxidase